MVSCVQILFEDIQSHIENVQVLNELMTQLSDLCVEGDRDFITDHTNSLTAHVDDLKEGTEGRKDLLETRMESWKAYPIQAAADVQEFLEAVSREVGEEEDDFDDCSTAELIERLERLEVRKRGREGERVGKITVCFLTQEEHLYIITCACTYLYMYCTCTVVYCSLSYLTHLSQLIVHVA